MNKNIKLIIGGGAIVLLITAFVIFLARDHNHSKTDSPIYITVSIPPVKYLVDRITGGEISVNVILPPGSSPETYEPTPRILKEIERSPIVYITGLIDFENTVANRVSKKSRTISLSDGIELIDGDPDTHIDHNHGHSHTHGVDPHIWSSPECLQIMAAEIFSSLPEEMLKEEYRANFEDLMWDLQDLDLYIIDKLKSGEVGSFLIYHPALTYYARDYGLEQLQLEYDGKEPSAEKLKATIEKANAQGLDKILYQKEFSVKAVEVAAKDINAAMVEIDPLEEDVIQNLKKITDIISERH